MQGSAKKNISQQATATPSTELSPMEANEEGFHEQRCSRKRNNSSENEAPQRGNKKAASYIDRQKQNKAIRNFFAPLRAEMEAEEKKTEEGQPSEEQQCSTGAGRQAATNSADIISEPDSATKNAKRPCERQLRVPKHT
jgi:hypothetical protein